MRDDWVANLAHGNEHFGIGPVAKIINITATEEVDLGKCLNRLLRAKPGANLLAWKSGPLP